MKYAKMSNISLKDTKLTVIVPVRNEEVNILKLLTDFNNQTYPFCNFEVIIANDGSSDATENIVLDFQETAKFELKLLNLLNEKGNSPKKRAIQKSIDIAAGELIITTDGDCRMGPDWITSIVSLYEQENCQLISSPVGYHQEKSLAEKIQTVEFELLIAAGAACIQNKFPNTCNGANLAYSRAAFHAVGGFKGIDELASGDDELLLHKMHKQFPGGLRFLKEPRAIVYTEAKNSLQAFFQQRKRWASKSVKYADKRMVLLVSLIYLFNLIVFMQAGLLFFTQANLNIFVVLIGVKLGLDGILIYQSLRFFKKRRLLFLLPLVEIFYVIYILIIGIIANIGGAYEWKGRTVN